MIAVEAAFAAAATERLVLRRPHGADVGEVHRIHADPATNHFNPAGPNADLEQSREQLQAWLDHWTGYGFGYWAVEFHGSVIGFSGLRHAEWRGRPILNLYYRFGPESWGRGLASEAAKHAVAMGVEHFPRLPIVARTKRLNVASQRTAIAAGLTRRPDLDGQDDDGTGHAVILASNWD